MKHKQRKTHVVLTSHPHLIYKNSPAINWGNPDPLVRGPIVGSLTNKMHRNVIGTHSGSYTVYRALAMAAKQMDIEHRPDLRNTSPAEIIGPFPSWRNGKKIVALDPWGGHVNEIFEGYFKKGYDIRPTIAVTKAHLDIPEIRETLLSGNIEVDGKIITKNHDVNVTKAAIEPVWYLPGIADRFGIEETELRKTLFEQTGGMFPELITRFDLKILLPPIGHTTVYIFGDIKNLGDKKKELTCRVHDECNGSDVFGSDICTCRPYLVHGIEEAIRTAQNGGVGVVAYFRKEGRSLGEVTKFLVYNARKRNKKGDTAAEYFFRTECVAGVQDMRFQELMPDVLHWMGIQRIDKLVSMSNMKYDAIVNSGIQVVQRIDIPEDRIPKDAKVEMEAKKAAGYFTGKKNKKAPELSVRGRKLNE